MRINLLSTFAAGILLATSICGVVYFAGEPVVSNAAETKTQPSETEMKNTLLKAGYVVQTKVEYDKNLEAAKKVVPPVEKKPEKVIAKAVITVEDGMTSIDVG
ncbi:MAG: aminodeoxychorismate lyase, partial [Bacillus sp. (in: Bacteria)]|nr:aminodeoxychorismate lyase [Bacillus sp. (in: firmicutes)]